MFKIGDFSKLSQVTVKTLHYYDEIDLFKPVEVDRFTGYRYYSASQLPRLNRILALKDLGLSLEQIKVLLTEEPSAADIRAMLTLKKVELEGTIAEEQLRLARVEARLKLIEQEGKMPEYDVVLKQVEAMQVASMRSVLPAYSHVGEQIGRLFAYIGQNQSVPVGPPMSIYHDHEYRESDVDVESTVPIRGNLPEGNGVTVRELPDVEVASVVYQGDFSDLQDAYNAIMGWIETNKYQITDASREVYLNQGESGEKAIHIVEIQFPVSKI